MIRQPLLHCCRSRTAALLPLLHFYTQLRYIAAPHSHCPYNCILQQLHNHKEWEYVSGLRVVIVPRELTHQKPLLPAILKVVDLTSGILLHYSIDLFRQIISLGVVYG